jgi:hypothetical protein
VTANRIRACCREFGSCAPESGVSPSTVTRIERGTGLIAIYRIEDELNDLLP